MSTLWPALGSGTELQALRTRWAETLMDRKINTEGYVHTQQHDGPAHAEGWPLPRWMEAGGIGWHFGPIGVPGYEAPIVSPEGWTVSGGHGNGILGAGMGG